MFSKEHLEAINHSTTAVTNPALSKRFRNRNRSHHMQLLHWKVNITDVQKSSILSDSFTPLLSIR